MNVRYTARRIIEAVGFLYLFVFIADIINQFVKNRNKK